MFLVVSVLFVCLFGFRLEGKDCFFDIGKMKVLSEVKVSRLWYFCSFWGLEYGFIVSDSLEGLGRGRSWFRGIVLVMV